jgi:hypothetical protein
MKKIAPGKSRYVFELEKNKIKFSIHGKFEEN